MVTGTDLCPEVETVLHGHRRNVPGISEEVRSPSWSDTQPVTAGRCLVSCTARSKGWQNEVWGPGAVAAEHRTDSLSSSANNMSNRE